MVDPKLVLGVLAETWRETSNPDMATMFCGAYPIGNFDETLDYSANHERARQAALGHRLLRWASGPHVRCDCQGHPGCERCAILRELRGGK